MVKLVAWNIARRDEAWRSFLDTDADVAFLSEAGAPPSGVEGRVTVDPGAWRTAGAGVKRPWRAAVVKLSNHVEVEWFESKSVPDAMAGDVLVSRPGALALARVIPGDGDPFVVASMYAVWEKPHPTTEGRGIYFDGSAHRLISDLPAFVAQQKGHRILAAGDLNIHYGYGEHGSYWASRYGTIFARMTALEFCFCGTAGTSRAVCQSMAC